ncbi:flagellar hook-basal body complex protein FliE [Escherichia coli]|nr:flagellar hook-basal body complex protein FliE [Escherichia coli]
MRNKLVAAYQEVMSMQV